MSYYTLFNLIKEPFSTSPDPAFFYHSLGHRTALHRLEIAIRLKKGLSLIFGDVGVGKTTLLRTLVQLFDEEDDFIFHMILDPNYKTEYQFWTHLTRVFGVYPFFHSIIDHRESIEKYLFQKTIEENKTVILLIDEGQKLTEPLLEIFRTLLNYETNEFKMLQLVIMAQLELLSKIQGIRNFMDRVNLQYIINPLDETETREMIQFRLRQAGLYGGEDLFTFGTMRKIYEISQGYPRKITLMCHNALERLVMEDSQIVTEDMIDIMTIQDRKW